MFPKKSTYRKATNSTTRVSAGIYPDGYTTTPASGRRVRRRRRRKGVSSSERKPTKVEEFCLDFAEEIDIFTSPIAFPDWVFAAREKFLRKLTPEFRRICIALRELGLKFKIKWPVWTGETWRFADIWFIGTDTVINVTTPWQLRCRPCFMMSDRAEELSKFCRVVEIETLEDLQRKIRLKAQAERDCG